MLPVILLDIPENEPEDTNVYEPVAVRVNEPVMRFEDFPPPLAVICNITLADW